MTDSTSCLFWVGAGCLIFICWVILANDVPLGRYNLSRACAAHVRRTPVLVLTARSRALTP